MVFFSPVAINMLSFKVNAMDNEALINSGTYFSVDRFISYKRNQAVGEQNGDISPINLPITSVLDSDVADSNSAKNSVF
ncbi:hypothetical protein PU629_03920 [Pullulanibacillus sp. KACC 23026]|uniref:hypothetical protein n=1 Tax=Pullulanibacillus sp. KACC 23026 TaxID=3028315 RepID=UPI0023B17ABF|nr:hypothetical protein [Pullulanibacillus sp. KACC 23026]WEG13524.1 hypothetical protein PU629_03920 [Pullulanibacillus sp. KACC 23026]